MLLLLQHNPPLEYLPQGERDYTEVLFGGNGIFDIFNVNGSEIVFKRFSRFDRLEVVNDVSRSIKVPDNSKYFGAYQLIDFSKLLVSDFHDIALERKMNKGLNEFPDDNNLTGGKNDANVVIL